MSSSLPILAHLIPTLPASSPTTKTISSHRRRRSSASISLHSPYPSDRLAPSNGFGASSGLPEIGRIQPLPSTPNVPQGMSLSRSPSPLPGGGWSTPGLNSGRSSPSKISFGNQNGNAHTVSWASAKAKSDEVNGYPSFSTRGNNFFGRHARKLSHSLPTFNFGLRRGYAEKEKLGRGRWQPMGMAGILGQMVTLFGRMGRRMRLRLLLLFGFFLTVILFYVSPFLHIWRRASFLGGGSKFVIILASNQGGGVMEWKGPREWAIERDSVKNKKAYAKRWGYSLDIVDMTTKKRYAHEWRESWEKVDTIRNAFRKYPKAEWFWWLDLNTYIMEPSYSLQSHVFDQLQKNTYRDINYYNPLNISHPFTQPYLDEEARSPIGDGKPESIHLIVPQDCAGFNLGSFFIRRGAWSDRLLDVWWDPVAYEQRHMEWEHKEQDALEYLYASHPWIRSHVAFIPQRKINSFPTGACDGNGQDPHIHYNEKDRDFNVNMAGCEWGRDCWGEMYSFRQLSYQLNRNLWEKFKDAISDKAKQLWNRPPKVQKEENEKQKDKSDTKD